MKKFGRAALLALWGLSVYLAVETFHPPERQPSAWACRGMLSLYRSVGSPVMRACGVSCRYSPSCSQYAREAIEFHGTLGGIARTAGRLWRCSPWGGQGYDPVASRDGR